MRIFEIVYLLLITGLVFGVPIAATTRPSGQVFSWLFAFKQAGVTTLILLALFALNFVVAYFVLRRIHRESWRDDDT